MGIPVVKVSQVGYVHNGEYEGMCTTVSMRDVHNGENSAPPPAHNGENSAPPPAHNGVIVLNPDVHNG